ncbi:recombination protein F [Aquisphaera giovannonii]|uniref:Recombination protein F n=1 Tax=Aquisphaera giovannonii TaxID=406548 RepID=A0A5B9W554_9BACT|nr:ATP-binding protein [Aquisphaera giovannonii]QEH35673.1 recombination protein F [Aquisphaera giovannonii]
MIERLYVHNYRCFENFTLDLTGIPSCLVIGKNGSGKSTLREALVVLQKVARGSNRVRDVVGPPDFTRDRTEVPMRFELEVALDARKFRYALVLEVPPRSREARVKEESLSVNDVPVFTRETSNITLSDGASFHTDWHVVALPIIYDKQGEDSIGQLRSFLGRMILVSPLPSRMLGTSDAESVELEPDASNFASCLNGLLARYPAAYGAMEAYLRSAITDFHSFENVLRAEGGRGLRVRFEDSDTGKGVSIDFDRLSDGEKAFFLSALVAAGSKFGDPVFCFWDEPDNHLSPSEVGHFVTELRRLANRNGQLIATSHNPIAIRSFSDENTLVFRRHSHLEPTTVRPLTDLPYHGDLIEALARDEVIG